MRCFMGVVLAGLGVAAPARAEVVRLACTEAPGQVHGLVLDTEARRLTVDGVWGKVVLPAVVQPMGPGNAALAVRATGPATTPMPVKSEVDACLAVARQQTPAAFAADGGVSHAVVEGCRGRARRAPASVVLRAELVMMMQPPRVESILVKRRHASDSGRAAELYGVSSLPMWQCRVAGG